MGSAVKTMAVTFRNDGAVRCISCIGGCARSRLPPGQSIGLLVYACIERKGILMSSTYSEDGFELTAASLSAVSSDTGQNTRGSHDAEEDQGTDEREEASSKLKVVLPKENAGADDSADASEAGYSSFDDDEAPLPLISPSFTVGQRDGRTTKQVHVPACRCG